MYIDTLALIIFITLILIGNFVMAFAYIRVRRQRNELSEQIHITAHECYNIGWDRAMEHVKLQQSIRNGEIADFIVNDTDGQ